MSQPRLIISAGPSWESLAPIAVNTTTYVPISTPSFEGRVVVRIVDFLGPAGDEGEPQPPQGFTHRDLDSVSWTIVVQGRFKEDLNADQLMWGNTWKRSIRDILPMGLSAALKIMKFKDPSSQNDLYCDTPWALSPWLAGSQYVNVVDHPREEEMPEWDTLAVDEDITALFKGEKKEDVAVVNMQGDPIKRKAYMGKEDKRKATIITPDHLVTADFAHGHIDFKKLNLNLAFGLSFPLTKYWSNQPITFVLRNRDGTKEYMLVQIELAKE